MKKKSLLRLLLIYGLVLYFTLSFLLVFLAYAFSLGSGSDTFSISKFIKVMLIWPYYLFVFIVG